MGNGVLRGNGVTIKYRSVLGCTAGSMVLNIL